MFKIFKKCLQDLPIKLLKTAQGEKLMITTEWSLTSYDLRMVCACTHSTLEPKIELECKIGFNCQH